MKKEIVIVGGGPGGYVAAIRAAQLGAAVTLIEKDQIGGTCLNAGCIPTKSLLHSADMLVQVKNSKKFGIECAVESVDWTAVLRRKEQVVKQLVKGVEGLMKSNQIEVIKGTARFLDEETLGVTTPTGDIRLKPDKIILATGSIPVLPPIKGLDDISWLDSSAALQLEQFPAELIIIGGGVIGIEFASIYQRFGSQVTIVEEQPEILPAMDQELAALLRRKLTKEGVRFLLGKRVEAVRQKEQRVTVSLGEETLTGEKLLVAVGRRSYVEGLGLEHTKIATQRGSIVIDANLQTTQANVYAIGDCVGEVLLAHYASAQGEVAAENALGADNVFEGKDVPGCVYSDPEFAGVGMTEEQAREKKIPYVVGKFPVKASGKALVMGQMYGVAKVVIHAETQALLGVHLLCDRATDMIAEATALLQRKATAEDVIETIHPHPTVSEIFREAVLAADKRAIHIPN